MSLHCATVPLSCSAAGGAGHGARGRRLHASGGGRGDAAGGAESAPGLRAGPARVPPPQSGGGAGPLSGLPSGRCVASPLYVTKRKKTCLTGIDRRIVSTYRVKKSAH
eukprot:532061-Prorocentrum_minimum.AAC.1